MAGATLAFWNLGPFEIVVILLVALLVFGRRLPEIARSLGQGLTEFRKGMRDEPSGEALPLPDAARGEDAYPEDGADGEAHPEVVEENLDGDGEPPEEQDREDVPAG